MNYIIKATSTAKKSGEIQIKKSTIDFGTTSHSEMLPNPAELFLSSLAACILKNVERFSGLMKFEYIETEIKVSAVRFDKPPRMNEIYYHLTIYTKDDSLNIPLLRRNIEKFGTIYNTINASCTIVGDIEKVSYLSSH